MYLQNVRVVMGLLVIMNLNVALYTDWYHGKKDPYGPYPRIPDEELLKKEIEFAKECRKHIASPKELFFY